MLAIGADADGKRHPFLSVRSTGRRRVGGAWQSHGAAMATIGKNQDSHTGCEAAQFEVQLVVDELAVVETPCFVLFSASSPVTSGTWPP